MDAKQIWQSLLDKLFLPETNLFYDYVTSNDPAVRFAHLPDPEEVRENFPNPCGWGTGMEDCMLNTGSALDVLWKLFPDPDFTGKVVAGIAGCCEVHGRPGFLARGITPVGEPCCYMNTSRDQLTLAVYGLWRVIHSHSGVSGKLRREVVRLLELIALDCRRRAVPENGFNLCRLDGRPGLVCNMWNCLDHEALRLPMIYLAAFEASGRGQYLDWAKEYLPEALEQTLSTAQQASWWHLPTVQMQLSILLIREGGCVPEFHGQLERALDQVAQFAFDQFLPALEDAEAFRGDWYAPNENWRTLPMKLQYGTISPDGRHGLYEGKAYLNPVYPESYAVPKELLHRLGSYLTAILAPGRLVLPEEWERRLFAFLERVDLTRCCSDGPLKLLHALCFLNPESKGGSI